MTQFTDKFIAFVDVLGFKQLVADAESGTGLPLQELLNLLEGMGTGQERARFEKSGGGWCPHAPRIEPGLDFRVTQISDCVIVSAEVSPAGAINLISHCWTVAMHLLRKGIMCRGYVKRGLVFHTDSQIIGSGYQDAYAAERDAAFRRETNERGTPFIEVDSAVWTYVDTQEDTCVKEMFSRMVKRERGTAAIFPFQRLSHQFIVGGMGVKKLDAEKERRSNQNVRTLIHSLKTRVSSFVNQSNDDAVRKAAHYLAALDAQLAVCDKTDEFINMMTRPAANVFGKP